MGITQINPLHQPAEMPHWRFITAQRIDYPDIDIDCSSYKKDIIMNKIKDYMHSIGGDIVRVGTFTTESAKKAIQTACRGLGIQSDVGLYISSLIPVVRGNTRSLHDTYYGNLEEELPPVVEFKNQIDKYEGLFETALAIENLVCGRGVHACGVIPSLNLLNSSATMRAPKGELITQYDLQDCEASGLIKYDFLSTKTMGMIQVCLEYLVEYGHMEWQGDLRATYDKYLHPSVINPEDPKYYEALNAGKLLSAFQFDSGAGVKALKAIKPDSLLELANANSLMRLMVEDGEQPIDKYVRYKNDPSEWERDMVDFGLNENERSILHSHLDKDYGVCSSQEGMMLLSMDERVAGFSVVDSNKLRKGVAKKVGSLYEQAHQLFYEKGLELGRRRVFLDYVWDVQIAMQKGYSFSILHTTGYSWIAIQQLHLITNYPPIYWACSVLQVESGAIDMEMEVEDDEEEVEAKEKNTNYDVIGGAIAMLQRQGVEIAYPDINKAQTGFAPNEENNTIIYGLKSLSGINNKVSEIIAENRPYTSMEDFYERLCLAKQEVTSKTGKTQMKSLVSNKQMLNLIKAGAFDELEGIPRKHIMAKYVKWTAPSVSKLNSKHIDTLINHELLGEEFSECVDYYNFKMYLTEGMNKQDETVKSIKWYLLDGQDAQDTEYCVNRFFEMFPELVEDRHWKWADDVEAYGNPIWVAVGGSAKASFNGVYNAKMSPLTNYLKTQECLDAYNNILFNNAFREYEGESNARWEMESMCMYHSDHELSHVDKDLYSIVNFHDLEEEPEVIDWWTKTDRDTGEEINIPKFRIDTIAGTVLGRNKTKHVVTLLTETGVVNVKMNSGAFSFYDKQISMPDAETGKNKIVEKSWFSRGNMLLVHGIRRGDIFVPKKYKGSSFSHTIEMIDKVYEDGYIMLRDERAQY